MDMDTWSLQFGINLKKIRKIDFQHPVMYLKLKTLNVLKESE